LFGVATAATRPVAANAMVNKVPASAPKVTGYMRGGAVKMSSMAKQNYDAAF